MVVGPCDAHWRWFLAPLGPHAVTNGTQFCYYIYKFFLHSATEIMKLQGASALYIEKITFPTFFLNHFPYFFL